MQIVNPFKMVFSINKIITLIGLFLCATISFAQEANTAAGGDADGVGGSASYSVGQISYTSITDPDGYVDMGVQIPLEVLEDTAITSINDLNLSKSISAYPNPTAGVITIKVGVDQFSNFSYELLNSLGVPMTNQNIAMACTNISLSQLPTGVYFLKVSNETKVIKTFKVIKN